MIETLIGMNKRNGHFYISICLEKSSVYVTLLVAYVNEGRVQLKVQEYWEFSKCYIESCMTGLIFSINSLLEDLELFVQPKTGDYSECAMKLLR